MMYSCCSRQTGEVRNEIESIAFNLDKRLWSLKVWFCASPRSRKPRSFANAVINRKVTVGDKCLACGSYRTHDFDKCDGSRP